MNSSPPASTETTVPPRPNELPAIVVCTSSPPAVLSALAVRRCVAGERGVRGADPRRRHAAAVAVQGAVGDEGRSVQEDLLAVAVAAGAGDAPAPVSGGVAPRTATLTMIVGKMSSFSRRRAPPAPPALLSTKSVRSITAEPSGPDLRDVEGAARRRIAVLSTNVLSEMSSCCVVMAAAPAVSCGGQVVAELGVPELHTLGVLDAQGAAGAGRRPAVAQRQAGEAEGAGADEVQEVSRRALDHRDAPVAVERGRDVDGAAPLAERDRAVQRDRLPEDVGEGDDDLVAAAHRRRLGRPRGPPAACTRRTACSCTGRGTPGRAARRAWSSRRR